MIDGAAGDAFRLTADPSFFWRQGQYTHAFDALRAAVLAGERFAVLTGEVGTGKTILVNALGQSLRNDGVVIGRLMYGRLETGEVWSALARAFGLTGLESREAFTSGARAAFLGVCAGARAAALIVDEAQTLTSDALLELERLAQLLSPGDRPILSVLLVGLPELRARLHSAECAGLRERIATKVTVVELSAAEVPSYIRHRLEVAKTNPELLPADVVGRIATASGGTPALINEMCHAFLAGFDVLLKPVMARPPAVSGGWLDRGRWPLARIGLVAAGVAGLGIAVFAGVHHRRLAPPPAAVVAPAAPVRASVDVPPPPAVEPPVSSAAVAERSGAPSPPVAAPERTPVQRQPSVARRPVKADLGATAPAVRTAPAPTAPPPSPVRTPRRESDEPDPSDVVDWLLKEGAARR